jgi:hypothetical protein
MRNSAGRLGAGLDVRGDDGYVLLPWSNHRDNPQPGAYQWTRAPWSGPVAPWPQALAERALAPKYATLPACPPAPDWLRERGADVPPGLLRFAREGKPEGERDNGGIWLACTLREEVRDETLALGVLADYAFNCNPPLGERDVQRWWRSACTRTSFGPRAARAIIPSGAIRAL